MNRFFALAGLLTCLTLLSCSGQPTERPRTAGATSTRSIVGGGCDGCELMFVGMPQTIASVDTSAGWHEPGQKLLVTGTVFQVDGRTPAPNVVIYYWHTDNRGLYAPVAGMDERARRHGHIRGWVKTDRHGKYALYTIRPAPYPNDVLPAHIHLAIKEPAIPTEYYVDELNFDDDPLLLPFQKKHPSENRGGSGVVRVLLNGDLQVAEHDMVLGLNIPNYPKKAANEPQSGLRIGLDQPSFTPFHAYGPDKGTRTCPVCKYGRYHGIIYYVGSQPNWPDIKHWLTFLELESAKRRQYLKAYFVYGNEAGYSNEARQQELAALGRELNIRYVALTFVPSFSDAASEVSLNSINPNVANTFVVYRHRRIVDKYVDLTPTPANFAKLSTVLTQTKGDFFDLKEPPHH